MEYDLELVVQAASLALGLCGLVLLITSWMKRKKNASDWAMTIGSTFALCGTIGFILALAGIDEFQSDGAVLVVIGTGTMGVILFTMGYAIDRTADRQKKDRDDYLNEVLPPR